MKPPCTTIVKYLLPAIRAKLARDLIEKHNFRTKDAAEALGLTQAAVSQYISSKRGQQGIKLLEQSKEATKVMNELLKKIVDGKFTIDEEIDYVCRLCEILRSKITSLEEIKIRGL